MKQLGSKTFETLPPVWPGDGPMRLDHLDELNNAHLAEIELYYVNHVFESMKDEDTFIQNPTVTPEERKCIRH